MKCFQSNRFVSISVDVDFEEWQIHFIRDLLSFFLCGHSVQRKIFSEIIILMENLLKNSCEFHINTTD